MCDADRKNPAGPPILSGGRAGRSEMKRALEGGAASRDWRSRESAKWRGVWSGGGWNDAKQEDSGFQAEISGESGFETFRVEMAALVNAGPAGAESGLSGKARKTWRFFPRAGKAP